MENKKPKTIVTVASVEKVTDASFLKNILEAEGIKVILYNDLDYPMASYSSYGLIGIQVPGFQESKASSILDEIGYQW